MEIIKISQSELKVTMTSEDMQRYDLDCDTLGENPEESRKALKCILREAKAEKGFSAAGERLLVRVFPSRDGGCEMFVTNLGAGEGAESKKSIPGFPARPTEGTFIYSFEKLNDMTSACRRLYDAGYRAPSAAYRDTGGKRAYYLVIGIKTPLCEEMGGVLMKIGTVYYINEFCVLLCLGAVDRLSEFA